MKNVDRLLTAAIECWEARGGTPKDFGELLEGATRPLNDGERARCRRLLRSLFESEKDFNWLMKKETPR